jgi:hypothetical protein
VCLLPGIARELSILNFKLKIKLFFYSFWKVGGYFFRWLGAGSSFKNSSSSLERLIAMEAWLP